ncbi:MAG: glycoside hydrolase family 57 protein [Kiritimatiellia bacterium]
MKFLLDHDVPDDVRRILRPSGYLCFVLHAHLPYVRHPEFPEFLEERWLFEAVRECYLPLLRVLGKRTDVTHKSRITVSLSPTLMAMLDDELLRQRCARHLDRVALMAAKEVKRTEGDAVWQPLAKYYESLSALNLDTWRELGDGDLVSAFIAAEKSGAMELITTAATHAFLPLWRRHPDAVRRQIDTGIEVFSRRIGHAPAGFWLPECGYYPGLEVFLADAGIRYFFLETHGILHAQPAPPHGVVAPLHCPNGLAAFGRDPESSRQVWSAQDGYPGDFDYREYYHDIGTMLPVNELKQIFPVADLDTATGFKYLRITGEGKEKEPYHPGRAMEKARLHAIDFLEKKSEQAAREGAEMEAPPVFVAPYDAELFGHWWFEGPLFLEAMLQVTDAGGPIAMITPSDYLELHPEAPEAIPSASTWGARGYNEVWLNDTTAWMYPHLFRAAERATMLDDEMHPDLAPELQQRLLTQARRELMLAQSSDWPFMLNAGSHIEYAEKRVRDHLARFYWLADALKRGKVDEERLRAIELVDALF